jgi:hypothetical protein
VQGLDPGAGGRHIIHLCRYEVPERIITGAQSDARHPSPAYRHHQDRLCQARRHADPGRAIEPASGDQSSGLLKSARQLDAELFFKWLKLLN